jgi:hypothetical protein
MLKRNLRVVREGERTSPQGKPVCNRILLAPPDPPQSHEPGKPSWAPRDQNWGHRRERKPPARAASNKLHFRLLDRHKWCP